MEAPLKGLDVSLEGISGCGKSYVLKQVYEALQDHLVIALEAIDERQEQGLDQAILGVLRKSGDRFFRSGHPRCDTALLVALLVYDAEHTIEPALTAGQIVLEDRSVDTFAIYQALILFPLATDEQLLDEANRLYERICQWRRAPDLTFLLVDDFMTTARRAQERAAGTYTPKDMALLRRAATLYERYACCYPERIVRVDRSRMDVDAIINMLCTTILSRYHCQEGAA